MVWTLLADDATSDLPEALRQVDVVVDRVDWSLLQADLEFLAKPRVQDDGSVVFQGVLAYADRRMRYRDGYQVATASALSNKRYLQNLVGISLVRQRDHKGDRPVNVRRRVGKPVGTIIGARWNTDRRCVVVDCVVTDADTIEDALSGKTAALSEGYRPLFGAPLPDGTLPQDERWTNHVAIVDAGRNPGAGLRVDEHEDDTMTKEEIEAAARAAAKAALEEKIQADAASADRAQVVELEAKLAAEKTRADAAEEKLEKLGKLGLRTDSMDADLDTLVEADAALRAKAAELGVKLNADSKPSTRVKDLALALGADKVQVDAADGDAYARGIIAGAKPTAAKRHQTGTSNRKPAIRPKA